MISYTTICRILPIIIIILFIFLIPFDNSQVTGENYVHFVYSFIDKNNNAFHFGVKKGRLLGTFLVSIIDQQLQDSLKCEKSIRVMGVVYFDEGHAFKVNILAVEVCTEV